MKTATICRHTVFSRISKRVLNDYRRRNGFTLLEIIVAIAILGIDRDPVAMLEELIHYIAAGLRAAPAPL